MLSRDCREFCPLKSNPDVAEVMLEDALGEEGAGQ